MSTRNKCINNVKHLLKDFFIEVDDEILNHVSELYPNEIAIERYTRKLILEKLEDEH